MLKKLTLCLFILFLSCSDDQKSVSTLKKNIAIICNQSSMGVSTGFLTEIDLNTYEKKEISLKEKLLAYKDAGNDIAETFLKSPVPHYVQTSFDGRYIYVIFTSMKGGVLKLDANYNILNFKEIMNARFPAHMQLTKDNSTLYVSTWTTNTMMGSGTSTGNNFIIKLNQDLIELGRYETPAGAHGIKLTPDEKNLIIGHDLVDYISIIDLDSFNRPHASKFALRSNAATDGSDKGIAEILSPTQLGVTPDGKLAFFSCKEASKILAYNITTGDTLGFLDLKTTFGLDEKLGPYSLEVGPKEGYSTSTKKYVYVNFKVGGYFARLNLNPNGTRIENILTADKGMDILSLDNANARPHGLDISDDGKLAVISSEHMENDLTKAKVYLVDLETFKITQDFNTQIESRGLCIYPSLGN